MKRVLIPNRGEIALRIVHACRRLGLESVVAASEPDRDGLAARRADRVVVLGPGPASESYLRDDAIVQAALGTGCDAIHPGYGFLSESPGWHGARARTGSRSSDRRPTRSRSPVTSSRRGEGRAGGVPVLAGGEVTSAAEARRLADQIGYPILIKAAGGGGGRGIKLADDGDELARSPGSREPRRGPHLATTACTWSGSSPARGTSRSRSRPTATASGALGERDCSVQRRYQKLIEEAPAPALDVRGPRAPVDAAVTLARTIGTATSGRWSSCSTLTREEFFFLEVNCRIQVEHPVTEAVTGRDLVALQLQIADGHSLGFTQAEVTSAGHAVECRLNAEDLTTTSPRAPAGCRSSPSENAGVCGSTRTATRARSSRRTTTR